MHDHPISRPSTAQIIWGTPIVALVVGAVPTGLSAHILSTAEMRHHADRVILQKAQIQPSSNRPRVLYRRLKGDVARIMVFFKIMNFSSGPDLRYTKSYTSILRLGLATGILLMPPITTSRPEDRAARSRPRPTPLYRESRPRTHAQLGSVSRGEYHASKSPTSTCLSPFERRDHRELRRASRSRFSSI
ncbi:hypothetical protein F511_09845 [Dorcoceras hygrometricum]|uniref:Uncharacterized protein n=1 Tax=Dorcoceras hygrometricum TaxID=472368 RepID=A0A2Z7CCQ2_9LAMI|nr:hypothetical protein F511_09845 [Dorcoceras hygrometricum]